MSDKTNIGPCDVCGKPGRWAIVVTGCSEHKNALKAGIERELVAETNKGVGPLQKISLILPELKDEILLAVYQSVVRECLKRDSILISYLSSYPSNIRMENLRGKCIKSLNEQNIPDKI